MEIPAIVESLLVSEAFIALITFLITWAIKTFVDGKFWIEIVKVVIKVAEDHIEADETDNTALIFLDKLLSKLHSTGLKTDKLEKIIMDEKELKKK